MTRKIPPAARAFGLTIAATLTMMITSATGFAASASSSNAPSPTRVIAPTPKQPAQYPADKIQELDEVWIHGKRLAERIADAEDDFYPLYNKVNKDEDYDMYCGHVYLSPDTMIMNRACAPGFLGKNYGAPAPRQQICYSQYYDDNTSDYRVDTDTGSNYYSPGMRISLVVPCVDGGYEPPSPEFIFWAKSEDLQKQMLRVIASDPQLLEKAAHLGDLYLEMASVQNRYRTAKGVPVKRASLRNTKLNPASAGRKRAL